MPNKPAGNSARLRQNLCAGPNAKGPAARMVTDAGRIAWGPHCGSPPPRIPTQTELLAWIEELCL